MAVDPENAGNVVLGSHGGIWSTTNSGDQWTVAQGLLAMDIRALATTPLDPTRLWLASWGSGIWQRPSSSQPWQRVSTAELPLDYAFSVAPDMFTAKRALVGGWSTLYQSNDDTSFAADPVSENEFGFAFDPTSPTPYTRRRR